MSFEKYLQDELGFYGGVKAHDTKFLELCVKKLKRRHFTLDEIIRKNLDQNKSFIGVYVYFNSSGLPSRKAPPLEQRIRLLKSALARMVDEGLLHRDRWMKDGAVHYTITDECVKGFKNM